MYCLFCDVLCTVCVYMCTVLLPPGGYPIAVNKYIISYIIWFTKAKKFILRIKCRKVFKIRRCLFLSARNVY